MPTENQNGETRVLFCCSGIGIINRGIESFFREAFDGLKRTKGLNLRLLKGAGCEMPDERVVWNLPRTGRLATCLGRIAGRDGYTVEQWSSFLSVVRQVRSFQPQVVFYSDANLGFLLFWLREQVGVPYNLLFSNGGPVHPPFARTDFVHQVAPIYYEEAMADGEPLAKHFMVPYGINLIAKPETGPREERNELRQRLRLPIGRKVILSVGWIRRIHKRMDYVIEEIARLPKPHPFLQLIGAMDEDSAEIVDLGRRLLGCDGFAVHSVPYERVFDYYRAADCFVLASLQEGFGRVYLEALMHDLTVIAHRNAISEYVLGADAIRADLSKPGMLAHLLMRESRQRPAPGPSLVRWENVRDRFSWPVLASSYRQMFQTCAR